MSNVAAKNIDGISIKELEPLASAMRDGRMQEVAKQTPLLACLLKLLSVQGWNGEQRQVLEALPHVADDLDIVDLRNILASLGQPTRVWTGGAQDLDPRLFPCLFLKENGKSIVILGVEEDKIKIFDPDKEDEESVSTSSLKGHAFLVDNSEFEVPSLQEEGVMRHLLTRFKKIVYGLLVMSMGLNVFGLIMPLTVMVIYDKVIGNKSLSLLESIAIGVAVLFVFELVLRFLRSKLMASVAGRIERLLGVATFQKLLSLPPNSLESAPVSSQIARLREFENVRDLFTGQLATILLDAPFFFVFLAVIGWLSGPLVLIPVVLLVLYCISGLLILPGMKRRVKAASQAKSSRHAMMVETLTKFRAIKETGSEAKWAQIMREENASAAYRQYQSQTSSVFLQTIAQTLMMSAGAFTLIFGAERAMNGDLSVGALVATMALVWRVLSPINMAFLTFPRMEQIRLSLTQLNNLMRLPSESTPSFSNHPVAREIDGDIRFNRVSMRYPAQTEPALLGINFEIKKGEMVGITGENGSGKSTILKLLVGMYQPQAGAITIDNLDIRQLDSRELRLNIGYMPQKTELFHGTIAQNLLMAEPTASVEQLRQACHEAGCLIAIESLADGFDTRLNDARMKQLPIGLKQKIGLARLYLRDAHILMLDEPAQALDHSGDAALIKVLKENYKKKTIIFTSHRPSHLRMCDRVIVIKDGVVEQNGRPEEVLAMPSLGGKK